ncbi:MAG: LPS assembly protein LptD, partial [Planctomycetota bacterium]
GPAIGSRIDYELPGNYGPRSGPNGFLDVWGISDGGLDTLGPTRRDLTPEKDFRGYVYGRHQQIVRPGLQFMAEVGLVSDRTFLEQYFESAWDQQKDYDTSLLLRQSVGNHQFEVAAELNANEFHTDTNKLPAAKHTGFGSDIGWLNWNTVNEVGYAQIDTAETPLIPALASRFTTLPGNGNVDGVVASSRHELSLPIDTRLGTLIPYVQGSVDFFGEDLSGNQQTRLLGAAGIRSALPMVSTKPSVQSPLLNLTGLTHKLVFTNDIYYADASENFDTLPLYDALDDDAQEEHRRRLAFDLYGGGTIPTFYDPRLFAIRQGLQRSLSNPSPQLAEDMLIINPGIRQRWQTKRGLPGNERVVDLARLDVSAMLHPDSTDINFGETVGPVNYEFTYNFGDRLAFESQGYFDFFDGGLRSVSAGLRGSRPGSADAYLGLLSIEGPISSTALRASVDYRVSRKYWVNAASTFDFGDVGNVGSS